MRLLLDEMLPPVIAQQLRKRDVDALAVAERPELLGLSDHDILAVATRAHRVVVTVNVGDFVRLARSWEAEGAVHAGILLVTAGRFPQNASRIGALTTTLAELVREATSDDELQNVVAFL